jgi:hypothetical protein
MFNFVLYITMLTQPRQIDVVQIQTVGLPKWQFSPIQMALIINNRNAKSPIDHCHMQEG